MVFASCNKHEMKNPLWKAINGINSHADSHAIDLFMWLGDAVYLDEPRFTYSLPFVHRVSIPVDQMAAKYEAQLKVAEYAELIRQVPVTGVWDDHDYGQNNGYKHYVNKSQAQKLYLDFLHEPKNSQRRKQEGIYGSYTFSSSKDHSTIINNSNDNIVKVIMLDVRYFADDGDEGRFGGDLLGLKQWKFLEEELQNSQASVHIIASGTQILPNDRIIIESWGDFPASRAKLFEMIRDYKVRNPLFISGDVHFAEILQSGGCPPSDLPHPIFEITSSGMTHSCYTWFTPFFCEILLFILPNTHTVQLTSGENARFGKENFAVIDFDWEARHIIASIRGVNNTIGLQQIIPIHPANFTNFEASQSICKKIEERRHQIRYQLSIFAAWVLVIFIFALQYLLLYFRVLI